MVSELKPIDPRDLVIAELRAWLYDCDQVGCKNKATCSEEDGQWLCDAHGLRLETSHDLHRAALVRALAKLYPEVVDQ